jgi:hypothetical protein
LALVTWLLLILQPAMGAIRGNSMTVRSPDRDRGKTKRNYCADSFQKRNSEVYQVIFPQSEDPVGSNSSNIFGSPSARPPSTSRQQLYRLQAQARLGHKRAPPSCSTAAWRCQSRRRHHALDQRLWGPNACRPECSRTYAVRQLQHHRQPPAVGIRAT